MAVSATRRDSGFFLAGMASAGGTGRDCRRTCDMQSGMGRTVGKTNSGLVRVAFPRTIIPEGRPRDSVGAASAGF